MAELTPMKRQYNEIKEQYQDCLLFFRLGDFYEMFDEDAKVASRELDLALTTRDRNVEDPEERTPMCGVPYHSCETYIARLIAKGYKVAICEQMEDPALAKGIVKRDVIRVISPGTVTESSMLEEERSNYICALELTGQKGGAAFCDVSTGEFCCASFENDAVAHILNELGRFSPGRRCCPRGGGRCGAITDFLLKKLDAMLERDKQSFDYMPCAAGCASSSASRTWTTAAWRNRAPPSAPPGPCWLYRPDPEIRPEPHKPPGRVLRRQVYGAGLGHQEEPGAHRIPAQREKRGSLLWVLTRQRPPWGPYAPLLDRAAPAVGGGHQAAAHRVQELYNDNVARGELMLALRDISDMQRLVGRAVYGTAGGRDLRSLANCAAVLPRLRQLLEGFKSMELRDIRNMDILEDMLFEIDRAICDDPPFSVREGGILRKGYSEEVDRLRNIRDNGAQMVRELEERQRQRTGIKKLKVGYNKVFGYYIDIPKSAGVENVPEDYIRKQTLVSNERYFTQELKELENTLLSSRDRINELEFKYFDELRRSVAAKVDRIKATAEAVARLDVLCSLAEVAVRNNYSCPEVDASRSLQIIQGRHPVVEQTLKKVLFVPNDSYLNDREDRVAIITGPNMAGKSTYMRQTALIVLMAQIGSFVPAKSATIGIVDRVFTRIGASDDLASGQSTFMVEMNEMAEILNHASAASLLILDEIGRGTSTFDGMAIARAVLEYCADKRKLGAKTMFATHYHELSALEGQLQGVRNYNITAKKQGGNLVFLRMIVPGAADDSYGIEVAKLAGLPESVIAKAKGYLKDLEKSGAGAVPQGERAPDDQISLADVGADQIRKMLLSADLNSLTPIEAMNLLYELQRKARS